MAKKETKPEWLVDFKRRIALIDIIESAFEDNCDCRVCNELRLVAEDLGKIFRLPEVEQKIERGKERIL